MKYSLRELATKRCIGLDKRTNEYKAGKDFLVILDELGIVDHLYYDQDDMRWVVVLENARDYGTKPDTKEFHLYKKL